MNCLNVIREFPVFQRQKCACCLCLFDYSHNQNLLWPNSFLYPKDTKLSHEVTRYITFHRPSIFLWLYSPLLDPSSFFSFLILYTVGRTPWTENEPVARSLPTYRTTQTQNKCTQTSIPQVEFEPTNPAFQRAKIFHALDRAATLIGP
jgi:hypothetical protein